MNTLSPEQREALAKLRATIVVYNEVLAEVESLGLLVFDHNDSLYTTLSEQPLARIAPSWRKDN